MAYKTFGVSENHALAAPLQIDLRAAHYRSLEAGQKIVCGLNKKHSNNSNVQHIDLEA